MDEVAAQFVSLWLRAMKPECLDPLQGKETD